MSSEPQMDTDKRGLVPRLRFPEFRGAGAWEEKMLGDVAIFFKGKGLPKNVITPEGKNACVHYGELFTDYPEVISDIRSRTDMDDNCFFSEENDVLMPTSDVTPNGLAKACCIKSAGVVLGGDILVIRTDKAVVNGEILSRLIRYLENQVLQYVSGTTVFHLYATSISKLEISIPSLKEQKKIANCLSSLDQVITAEAEKLDALKAHKNGLMQQLFPREGETLPHLRFPEFRDAGAWEEKMLGDVAIFFKGKGLPKNVITLEGKNACVHYGELFTDYPEVISDIRSRTDMDDNCFFSEENDVLMPTSDVTPNGLAKACCIKSAGVVLGGDILVIRTDKAVVNGEILSRLIRYLENQVLQYVSGTTVFHLYATSISKLEISIPSLKEQQKIADCLSSLDEVITRQTQKIAALKAHKTGLMQQLFPSGETVG